MSLKFQNKIRNIFGDTEEVVSKRRAGIRKGLPPGARAIIGAELLYYCNGIYDLATSARAELHFALRFSFNLSLST